MSALLTLSADVLTEISALIPWEDVTRLWLCGNQTLCNRLVGAETRSLVVECGPASHPLPWPWALPRMPNLRYLRVKAHDMRSRIVCPDIDLQTLPKSLTHLELRFSNTFYAFMTSFLPNKPVSILYDMSKELPNLKTLYLEGKEGLNEAIFDTLPPGLTDLTLCSLGSRIETSAFLSKLPQDLVYLRLKFLVLSLAPGPAFPPDLKRLFFQAPGAARLLDLLPQSLVDLSLREPFTPSPSLFECKKLPRGLTRLDLDLYDFRKCVLQGLPERLKVLRMPQLQLNNPDLELPQGIQRLIMPICTLDALLIPRLPPALQYCNFSVHPPPPPELLEQLPRSLRRLRLGWVEEGQNMPKYRWNSGHFAHLVELFLPHLAHVEELPPALTSLTIQVSSTFQITSEAMQVIRNAKSLREFRFPSAILPLDSPFFPLLPPSLTRLEFTLVHKNKQCEYPHEKDLHKPWPTPDLKVLTLPTFLLDTSAAIPKVLSSLATSTPDLLELELEGFNQFIPMDAQDFALLPRRLHSLSLQMKFENMGGSSLGLLPPDLTKLSLRGSAQYEPEAVKLIPRSVCFLDLPGMNAACVPYLPPNLLAPYSAIPSYVTMVDRHLASLIEKYPSPE